MFAVLDDRETLSRRSEADGGAAGKEDAGTCSVGAARHRVSTMNMKTAHIACQVPMVLVRFCIPARCSHVPAAKLDTAGIVIQRFACNSVGACGGGMAGRLRARAYRFVQSQGFH